MAATRNGGPIIYARDHQLLQPICFLDKPVTLLLDRRSINLSGAREKEGHFHYKNFLRALK